MCIWFQVNGLSNNYWGWGLEDDELYVRIKQAGLQVFFFNNINNNNTPVKYLLHAIFSKEHIACYDHFFGYFTLTFVHVDSR